MRQFFASWTTKDFATAAVALYGAILSTYSSLAKWRENRPNIRVTIQLAIAFVPRTINGYGVRIAAQNHGFRDVHFEIAAASVQVKGTTKTLVLMDQIGQALPRTLKHGEEVSVFAALESLKREIKAMVGPGNHKVRGVMSDTLSRAHVSDWNTMEVE